MDIFVDKTVNSSSACFSFFIIVMCNDRTDSFWLDRGFCDLRTKDEGIVIYRIRSCMPLLPHPSLSLSNGEHSFLDYNLS